MQAGHEYVNMYERITYPRNEEDRVGMYQREHVDGGYYEENRTYILILA